VEAGRGRSSVDVDWLYAFHIMKAAFVSVFCLSLAMCAGGLAQQSSPSTPLPHHPRFGEPDPYDFDDHAGFVSIFDGKTLKDWDGDPTVWHVEDGAIIGRASADHPIPNTYISYHGATAHDFDLKLEVKVEEGGGTGVQYRSSVDTPWMSKPRAGTTLPPVAWLMTGPQADFWFPVNAVHQQYSGQFYSENTPLGILAWRGQVNEAEPDGSPRLVGTIGDRAALGGYVVVNGWNQYEIIARGGVLMHILNGRLMAVYIDDNSASSNNNRSGLIGIELEGAPTKISVRNVWLHKLN
jgi:hypothetical protein